MNGKTADAVVIGGGVAGLAAAHHLRRQGKSVILLEELSTPGGRASTALVDNLPVDLGGAFISDFYTATMRLVEELNLSGSLIQRSQTAYVIRQSRPEAIWPAPQLISGHALPVPAKLRLIGLIPALLRNWQMLDISDLSKIAHADQESAAAYAAHSIGKEDAEYFFTPLLRGLLYWDPESTSAAVVWCILKAFATSKATYRFAGGMRDLTDALASQAELVCEAKATHIARNDRSGFTVSASVSGEDSIFHSNLVVCATPASVAAGLADRLPAGLKEFLMSVAYTSTAILTYRVSASLANYPQGAYLFPASSVPDLTSVNPLYHYVDSSPAAAQDRLLNVYLSDRGARDYASLSDADLGHLVLGRLAEELQDSSWTREAKLVHAQRWPLAIPRFDVGYIKAKEQFSIQQGVAIPGLAFAGDYLGGPYIDGAVRSGIQAAQRALSSSSTK